jgi:hypothetical protein
MVLVSSKLFQRIKIFHCFHPISSNCFATINRSDSAVEPRPPLRQRRRANGGGSRLQRRSYFPLLVFPSTNRSNNFVRKITICSEKLSGYPAQENRWKKCSTYPVGKTRKLLPILLIGVIDRTFLNILLVQNLPKSC